MGHPTCMTPTLRLLATSITTVCITFANCSSCSAPPLLPSGLISCTHTPRRHHQHVSNAAVQKRSSRQHPTVIGLLRIE
jgi:hypothetical protein